MAAAMLGASCLATAAEDVPVERATFGRATGEITLDGRLDEASWLSATPRTKFYETYPANVAEPAVTTSVSFLYDERNVYVAIRALDPNPASIRAPIVRRDQVLEDQDYVEVFLDPLNTRRSALFFRVNPRGVVTDGQYDDKNRLRDYSPDLNFDAAASINEEGWTAEFRIPLSSLRYRSGVENSWAYIVYRNLPRTQVATISSARIPRGENCDLCYADTLKGIEPAKSVSSLSVIPHIEYARLDDDFGSSDELDAGVDLTWKPRENTVIDATVFPDFSQIEADAPQLKANTQFALALTEKRPFFLEGPDLLTTQIPVIYTRAFTDPDAGVRITDRSSRHEFTVLALRDAGGGTIIEPGPINSRMALQDFKSSAFVGRNRFLLNEGSVGMLASARFNDDGSHNVVIGADGTWTPSPADQITAQFLGSETRNPNRPDLLDRWTGQQADGNASSLSWTHSVDSWYSSAMYESYSRGFRTWNGFVTQVDVSSFTGVGSLYFYPDRGGLITRFGPSLTATQIVSNPGQRLSRMISPGFAIRAAGDTEVSFAWRPHSEIMTLAGLRSHSTFVLGITATPFAWMPRAALSVTVGEVPDNVAGRIGDGFSAQGTIPLRFARLEITPTGGYQTLEARGADGTRKVLFAERNLQLTATWHFSNEVNLRVMYQRTSVDTAPPFAGLESAVHTSGTASSVLLSYQKNWRTRCYIGALVASDYGGTFAQHSEQTQVFAKFSYAFSR